MRIPKSISFDSPIIKIDELRFYALPKDRSIEVDKVALSGPTTVYQDKTGKLYSLGVRNSGCYIFGRGRGDDYVRCAAKLGLISSAEMREHLKMASEHDEKRRIQEQSSEFKKSAVKLGIQLNQKQLRRLDSLAD